MPAAAQQPKPVYNKERFEAYKRSAAEFVDGQVYDANEIGHMLHDIRHEEVPKAFAVALFHATKTREARPGLTREFRALVEMAVLLGFGSTDRALVQPWFLQNWDAFFVSCADGLLNLHKNDQRLRRAPEQMRRAVRGLLALVGGARNYMSLDRLVQSSAVHALLVAAGHTKSCFLKNGFRQMGGEVRKGDDAQYSRPLTLAHIVLMDEVAAAVLAQPERSVDSWERAFGHYAGAAKWRAFAMRCRSYCTVPGLTAPALSLLERQVEQAVAESSANAWLEAELEEHGHRCKRVRTLEHSREFTEALLDFAARHMGGGGGLGVGDFLTTTPSPPPAAALRPSRSSSSSSSSSGDDCQWRREHPRSPDSTLAPAEEWDATAYGCRFTPPVLACGAPPTAVEPADLADA